MQNIHWLGSGLSSIPGIRRLASNNYNLTVWNRTLSKAQKSIDHVKSDKVSAKILNIDTVAENIEQGDIIVSQLTASMHLDIAKICLEKKCHFVTTSYLTPDIKKLNEQAVVNNLIFINEPYLWLFLTVLIGGQIGSHLSINFIRPIIIRRLTSILVIYVSLRILLTDI